MLFFNILYIVAHGTLHTRCKIITQNVPLRLLKLRASRERKFARGNPRRDLPDLFFTVDSSILTGRKQNVQVGIKLRFALAITRAGSDARAREYLEFRIFVSADRLERSERLKMPRS